MTKINHKTSSLFFLIGCFTDYSRSIYNALYPQLQGSTKTFVFEDHPWETHRNTQTFFFLFFELSWLWRPFLILPECYFLSQSGAHPSFLRGCSRKRLYIDHCFESRSFKWTCSCNFWFVSKFWISDWILAGFVIEFISMKYIFFLFFFLVRKRFR